MRSILTFLNVRVGLDDQRKFTTMVEQGIKLPKGLVSSIFELTELIFSTRDLPVVYLVILAETGSAEVYYGGKVYLYYKA